MTMFSDNEFPKKVVRQYVEVYQRMPNGRHKRIASLPDADDFLLDFIKDRYKSPLFHVRVKTVLF